MRTRKNKKNKIYSITLDGFAYPSIQMVARALNMKQITLMQRVLRAGGNYELKENYRHLIIKTFTID